MHEQAYVLLIYQSESLNIKYQLFCKDFENSSTALNIFFIALSVVDNVEVQHVHERY